MAARAAAGQQGQPALVNGHYLPRHRVEPESEVEELRKALAEAGQLLTELKDDIAKFAAERAISKGTAS